MSVTVRQVSLSAASFVALSFLLPSSASAGGSITDGNATFTIGAFGAGPTVNLTGASDATFNDHLFASGWWYRIGDATEETPFPAPNGAEVYEDRVANFEWYDFDGIPEFDVDEWILLEAAQNIWPQHGAVVRREMTLINGSEEPVELKLFHYVDPDLDASLAGDNAYHIEYGRGQIVEAYDGSLAHFVALPGSGDPIQSITYRVAPLSDGLLAQLNNDSVSHFTDTGLPFGPGDLTIVYEFALTVAPQDIVKVVVGIAVNAAYYCGSLEGIFCDGFETAGFQFSYWDYLDIN